MFSRHSIASCLFIATSMLGLFLTITPSAPNRELLYKKCFLPSDARAFVFSAVMVVCCNLQQCGRTCTQSGEIASARE